MSLCQIGQTAPVALKSSEHDLGRRFRTRCAIFQPAHATVSLRESRQIAACRIRSRQNANRANKKHIYEVCTQPSRVRPGRVPVAVPIAFDRGTRSFFDTRIFDNF